MKEEEINREIAKRKEEKAQKKEQISKEIFTKLGKASMGLLIGTFCLEKIMRTNKLFDKEGANLPSDQSNKITDPMMLQAMYIASIASVSSLAGKAIFESVIDKTIDVLEPRISEKATMAARMMNPYISGAAGAVVGTALGFGVYAANQYMGKFYAGYFAGQGQELTR